MARSISFDGNNLQTANILTQDIDSESIPTKVVNTLALAHASGSRIPFTGYSGKTIMISGNVNGSSVADLDAKLDIFRGYFNGQDKNLDIGYGGGTRRYIATVNSITIKRPGGLMDAHFDIEFICTQPFGQNTSTTSALSASGRTSATYTDSYTFLGTAPYQRPVWTYTLTAVTGGTTQTITIGNNTNGQQITITRTWTAADVLVVDVINKVVTVNGVATDFTGAFPEFAPGAQSLFYSDGFTTRTFTISVVYYPMFQ